MSRPFGSGHDPQCLMLARQRNQPQSHPSGHTGNRYIRHDRILVSRLGGTSLP
jgi:hypothetical protein